VPLGKFGDALVLRSGLRSRCASVAFCTAAASVTSAIGGGASSYPAGSGVFGLQHEQHLIPPDATWSLPVQPLHLYFLAAGLAVTWLGYWLEPRKQYDGQVALLGLLLFSTSTAALELLRAADGSSPLWGPVPQLVWTGIGMSVASFVSLLIAQAVHTRHAVAPLSRTASASR
jgi:prolipoprotein diacylglyceryltransferase